MQGNRVALGAGDILLFRVHLVTSRGGNLEPGGIITLMTLFTSVIRNYSVSFYSLKFTEGKIKKQLGTGEQTLLVAAMTACIFMFAGGPTVPGLFHDMTRATEVRVLLYIAIETNKLVATKGYGNQDNDRNRYSYPPGRFTCPMPEAP